MAKQEAGSPAIALHDFYKTNGLAAGATARHPEGPSMTRQEFADECDINNIMAQYDRYLSDPMRGIREPLYLDFTAMPDTLMGVLNVVKEGEEAFMSLPAVVRKEFDNDPVAFLGFASNPENLGQMREWGLAPPEKAPDAPLRVQVVQDIGGPGGPPAPVSGVVEPSLAAAATPAAPPAGAPAGGAGKSPKRGFPDLTWKG